MSLLKTIKENGIWQVMYFLSTSNWHRGFGCCYAYCYVCDPNASELCSFGLSAHMMYEE